MFQNEQFSESITRRLMQFDVGQNDGFYVYPQGVGNSMTVLKDCLNQAGGKPKDCLLEEFPITTNGTAKPEYIITFTDNSDTIIVIECKKYKKDHFSENLSHPQKYAIDGVLYYAKYLKKEFNVIAIAVSGTNMDDYLSNAYYWKQGANSYTEIEKTKNILLSPINYLNLLEQKKLVKKFSIDEIKQLANRYNVLMREKLNIPPQERIMFIASCLLALQNDSFARTYSSIRDNQVLVENIITCIKRVLENNGIPKEKIQQISNNAELIKNYQELLVLSPQEDGSLIYFLKQLEFVIIPMINDFESHQDALGIFYHEFIKYTAGNTGHELGIVLTPEHLCDFMCEVANLSIDDVVIDICCGTGSFLVSAMKHLIAKAENIGQISKIKNTQLYGIELQPSIYSIAITNMILRGDGQSNIFNDDCFRFKVPNGKYFTVGLLNPPYSQKKNVELKFVKKMLDLLSPRGIGVVVVPMSCAIGTKYKQERSELFEHHTLEAVFSMPDDIFYPVGTNVCVMVWIAHQKHNCNIPTFFGYYKDDGFIKRKNIGRTDPYNKWFDIKNEWVELYRKKQVVIGKTAKHRVTHKDEWLAEAYMETDYSNINAEVFRKKVREYIAYLVTYERINLNIVNKDNMKHCNIDLNDKSIVWKSFDLNALFKPKRGTRLRKEDRVAGDIPLVTAGEGNLGVKAFISNDEQEKHFNKITIDMFCNCYLHIDKFCCDDNVIALEPKYEISKYTMIFICTIIELDKYKYQYGRQYRMKNFESHKIKLPLGDAQLPNWEMMEDYIKSLPYSEYI